MKDIAQNILSLTLPERAISFETANVVGSKLKYLMHLSLCGCGHAVGDFEFKNLIFTCKSLKSLDISFCYAISNVAIVFMASTCAQLEHFVWRGHNCDSYDFLDYHNGIYYYHVHQNHRRNPNSCDFLNSKNFSFLLLK